MAIGARLEGMDDRKPSAVGVSLIPRIVIANVEPECSREIPARAEQKQPKEDRCILIARIEPAEGPNNTFATALAHSRCKVTGTGSITLNHSPIGAHIFQLLFVEKALLR